MSVMGLPVMGIPHPSPTRHPLIGCGLFLPIGIPSENATVEQIRKRAKWDNDDYVYRGLIVNGMFDPLFDTDQNVESSKELSDFIEAKYMVEDVSSKKFLDKLTLVELGSNLHIGKSLRVQDNDKPKGNNVFGPSVVNMVEHNNSSRFYVIEPNESVSSNLIKESKDDIFYENRFSSVPRPSLRILNGSKYIGASVVLEKVIEEDDPKTFDEAMRSQDVAFWKEAIKDEITIRLLIAMSSTHNLIIHQMNVKTSVLDGELEEEQAPKQWHQKFNEVVFSNGYLLNQANIYVYSKFDETGEGVIICLYVDDMLIFGANQVELDLTNEFLSSRFSMKDMGEANVILVSTLMDTNEKLMPNNGQAISQRILVILVLSTGKQFS
nr:zinc finger, CCHC-type [Tanacetum cinerariifolium]